MNSITKKDVASFMKVFAQLQPILAEQPEALLTFLESHNKKDATASVSKQTTPQHPLDFAKITNFPLFELARTKQYDELSTRLSTWSAEELKTLIKHHKFSATRVRTVAPLVIHIVSEVKSLTTDVFSEYGR